MTLSRSISQQWLDSWKAGKVRAETEERSDVFGYIWYQCARLTHADSRERSKGGEEWTKAWHADLWEHPTCDIMVWHLRAGEWVNQRKWWARMKEWWVTDTDPSGFEWGMIVKERGTEGQEEGKTAKWRATGAVYGVQTIQGSQCKTTRNNFSIKLLTSRYLEPKIQHKTFNEILWQLFSTRGPGHTRRPRDHFKEFINYY